jgi:hypothetical protein
MVGEVIVIVLRNCRCVFGQFFYTNNRKACVDGIIWLVKYIISQINFIIDQAYWLVNCLRITTGRRYLARVLAKLTDIWCYDIATSDKFKLEECLQRWLVCMVSRLHYLVWLAWCRNILLSLCRPKAICTWHSLGFGTSSYTATDWQVYMTILNMYNTTESRIGPDRF